LAIGDTGRDALAHDNPLVRELGLAAYLGVPLIDGSGYALGSVCVADRRPRDWTPEQYPGWPGIGGLRGRAAAHQLSCRLVSFTCTPCKRAAAPELPGGRPGPFGHQPPDEHF
jgi:hypothetical protein